MLRCYITDRHSAGGTEALLEIAARRMAEGVDWIQVREKDMTSRELLALVRAMVALPNPHSTKVLVNGRADIVLAAKADGLHLPSGAVEAAEWRRILPVGALIGVSCHSLEEVRAAEREGADYALFSPVFDPLSKAPYGPAQGLAKLAAAARMVRIPVLALGGITPDNAALCVEAGAAGIAAISLFQSPMPVALPAGTSGASD